MEPDLRTSTPRRVEAYLDQILAPLARRLSPFHRDELRRELREHLWARVDAYRELGQSEENAVTEALRQFGGAKDFTRQWRREWMKTPPRVTLREVWEAMRPAFRLSLTALVFVPAWAALAGWIAFDSALGGPSLGAVFNVSLAGTVFVLPLPLRLEAGPPCAALFRPGDVRRVVGGDFGPQRRKPTWGSAFGGSKPPHAGP